MNLSWNACLTNALFSMFLQGTVSRKLAAFGMLMK